FAAQQFAAQFRVGGVDGDVERRKLLFLDARPLLRREIGQRDVVAVHEGEAEIVVYEVERLPHLFGHLVNKAEDALVFAGVDLIAQVKLKRKAGVLVLALAYPRGKRLPVALQDQAQARLGGIETVVQDVEDGPAVDLAQQVAGAHSGPLRRAARLYPGDEQGVEIFQYNF